MSHASREVTVLNEQGFHARPAMKFVDAATGFESDVQLTKLPGPDNPDPETVDGKSIMFVLTLMGAIGTTYRIEADGTDAEAAVNTLAQLFAAKFDEE
ncbi:MAG: HPr family phosphocarrier protein [Tepidisphaeraceae bacterium]